MKTFIFSIVALFLFSVHTIKAQPQVIRHQIDSIEVLLPKLEGASRIEALTQECNLASLSGNAQLEESAWRRLFHEADKQGDKELASRAYLKYLRCFYNQGMYDGLLIELPLALKYLAQVGNDRYYFEGRQLQIEVYLRTQQDYEALMEMQRVYDDAKTRNCPYGQAIALSKMGSAFAFIYRDRELAIESYAKALEMFASSEIITRIEMGTYFEYAYALYQLERWDELRTTIEEWKVRLDVLNRKYQEDANDTNKRSEYYFYWDAMMLITKTQEKSFDDARAYLATLREFQPTCPSYALPMVYEAYEIFFTGVGLYDSALYYIQRNRELAIKDNDIINSIEAISARAAVFMAMKQYDSAARLYEQYITMCDSAEIDSDRQLLDEFRSLSQEHDQESTQNKFRTRLLLVFGITLLALIFVLLLFVHARRLRKRHRILYEIIQSSLIRQEILPPTPTPVQNKSHTEDAAPDGELYLRLRTLMMEKRPYSNPRLDDGMLAEMLATNRNTLAEIIKAYANGVTIGEYIEHCRVKYAAELIASFPRSQLTDVELVAGFTSRADFNQAFRQYFGMSPAEYRNIAIEYKPSLR